MGAIAPIRTAKDALFLRVSGACSSAKIFEIKSCLRCILVHSGPLNLASAWIPY